MKPLLLILLLTLTTLSQVTLDSAQVSRLLYKLDSLAYLTILDSLNNIELKNKDTIIENSNRQINNLNFVIGNYIIDVGYLRGKVAELQAEINSKWKWYDYTPIGILLIILGYLAGHL